VFSRRHPFLLRPQSHTSSSLFGDRFSRIYPLPWATSPPTPRLEVILPILGPSFFKSYFGIPPTLGKEFFLPAFDLFEEPVQLFTQSPRSLRVSLCFLWTRTVRVSPPAYCSHFLRPRYQTIPPFMPFFLGPCPPHIFSAVRPVSLCHNCILFLLLFAVATARGD